MRSRALYSNRLVYFPVSEDRPLKLSRGQRTRRQMLRQHDAWRGVRADPATNALQPVFKTLLKVFFGARWYLQYYAPRKKGS